MKIVLFVAAKTCSNHVHWIQSQDAERRFWSVVYSVFIRSGPSALSMVLPRFGVVNLSRNTVNRCMQKYACMLTLNPAELTMKINHHEECHPFVSCVRIFLRPFVHSKAVRVGCNNTRLGADSLNL